jgi:hypothetical protein
MNSILDTGGWIILLMDATSSIMAIRILSSRRHQPSCSVVFFLDYCCLCFCRCWLINLMTACVHVALALWLELKITREPSVVLISVLFGVIFLQLPFKSTRLYLKRRFSHFF